MKRMSAHWQKKIICIWLYKNDPQAPTGGSEHLGARPTFPEGTQFSHCYKIENIK